MAFSGLKWMALAMCEGTEYLARNICGKHACFTGIRATVSVVKKLVQKKLLFQSAMSNVDIRRTTPKLALAVGCAIQIYSAWDLHIPELRSSDRE